MNRVDTSKPSLFHNPWRFAFWAMTLLVLLLFGAALWFWVSITSPAGQEAVPPPAATTPGVPVEANVSLEAINRYVAMQLKEKETPVQNAKISFENERVRADAALTFFGRSANLIVWMRPEVRPNGDVRMVAEDVTMGDFPIPLKTLFAVLEGVPWPTWVHVQSEQFLIDFNLSERPDSDFRYQIKKIDWVQKRIQLDILLGT